jgi:hypothetical protein
MAILSSTAEHVIVTDLARFVSHANAAALALCRREPVGSKFAPCSSLSSRLPPD